MRYEIQTFTLCDGWVNTWTDNDELPVTFETLDEAENELKDYLEDLRLETYNGTLTDFDIESFRVSVVDSERLEA